ncbi:Aspartate dehydrogenase [Lentibacillus sp. JNUCC-1]|uniref:aspartate dehydrogenase n=1 Tax=Lentibacillus sp. JNUCC-1 TaxID=2654513 RepID=UPI0012E869AA|nr:aspartate dehydrogenase [Lentibacillus sp. JNUCC-1]MUV36875.1 Aspartate dehydrogenase [Lentibacillus sp. JNUCC-1]
MNIGVVGAGAIARFLLKEINQNGTDLMQIKSVFVRDLGKYQNYEQAYGVKLYDELDAFLDSEIDIVVEAANVEAVQVLFPKIITKKDIMLISIGALAEGNFLQEMAELAKTYRRTIHLPSGAIGGLDLLQNAHATGEVTEVTLTTRKPAHTLISEEMAHAQVVFEGNASEAIEQYPKNINVSIILSIAGLGVDATNVTIIADPAIENNIHTIDIKGEFGEARFSVTNHPLKENPKTSHLAAMSILGTLQRVLNHVKIGG